MKGDEAAGFSIGRDRSTSSAFRATANDAHTGESIALIIRMRLRAGAAIRGRLTPAARDRDCYGGSAGWPCSSPPVRHTARSHGPVSERPNRSTHARTASVIASTASPSALPAGATAPISGSSEHAHRVANARKLPARSRAARSQPRTVLGGRPSRRAIVRCPAPPAAIRNASPITSEASRRRGTSHDGASTCVVSHAPQRARRGLTERTSCRSRTSRDRANPHGDNGAEHAGHATCPAASAASSCGGVIAI